MYTDARQLIADVIDSAKTQVARSDRDEAAQRWHDAKRREDQANADRLAAEADIVRLYGAKDKGATTIKTDAFKVTTTGNQTTKFDEEAYKAAKSALTKPQRDALIRTKYEIDAAAFNALRESDPAAYLIVCRFVSVTPAKTSVKVEKL